MAQPRVVRTARALRAAVARWRAAGESVALVPTMGALHDGHLALVKLARRRCKRVVVSIFVNPRQFAPNEDFGRYPREEKADVRKLSRVATDLVYAPAVEEIYPDGFITEVRTGGAAEGLESATRPHFFGGVATVVTKLLIQAAPDIAIFGEKDFQQLRVLEQVARDLDLPVRIVGAPVVREADGLALSSRNAYLSPKERVAAPAIYDALSRAAAAIGSGEAPQAAAEAASRALCEAGFTVDYVEARNADTLAPLNGDAREPVRLLAAARLGSTRLIDNIAVPARP
jgi:pantoate--beta-alanine ligase